MSGKNCSTTGLVQSKVPPESLDLVNWSKKYFEPLAYVTPFFMRDIYACPMKAASRELSVQGLEQKVELLCPVAMLTSICCMNSSKGHDIERS